MSRRYFVMPQAAADRRTTKEAIDRLVTGCSKTSACRRGSERNKKMSHRFLQVSALLLLTGASASPLRAQTPILTVDLNKPKAAVSPTLYGLMTEEINYSYDGGLYGELVRNRTFRSDWTGVLNWFVLEKGSAAAKLIVDTSTGPSTALGSSAKLDVTRADAMSPAGVLNEGYWGFAVRPNTLYTGSFFAKSAHEGALALRIARLCCKPGGRLW
jgi:hypothetical protein